MLIFLSFYLMAAFFCLLYSAGGFLTSKCLRGLLGAYNVSLDDVSPVGNTCEVRRYRSPMR